MKTLTCKCCGAPLVRKGGMYKCEYCGTLHTDTEEGFAIIGLPARTEHLRCESFIDTDMWRMMGDDPDQAASFVMRDLSRKIAEAIAPMMRYTRETDYPTNSVKIRGDIGIVLPDEMGWRLG